MQLHAHPIASLAIHSLTEQSLTINQVRYTSSIQISPHTGVTVWDVDAINSIQEHDIKAWTLYQPELIILGTGKTQHFLSPKWVAMLASSRIGIECMNTSAAARTYNLLLEEGRHVLGAFIMPKG